MSSRTATAPAQKTTIELARKTASKATSNVREEANAELRFELLCLTNICDHSD